MMDIISHIGTISGIDDAIYDNTDTGTAQKILSLARYLLATNGQSLPGITTCHGLLLRVLKSCLELVQCARCIRLQAIAFRYLRVIDRNQITARLVALLITELCSDAADTMVTASCMFRRL